MTMIVALAVQFATMSLLAFGGVNAMLPEIHRVTVEQMHWLTTDEFNHLFAIAQAAPGPNLLILSLLGWHVGGLSGAIAATAGFCVPSGAMVYAVVRVWNRFREARWRRVAEAGIGPLAVGLVVASGLHIAIEQSTGPGAGQAPDVRAIMLVAGVTLVSLFTRVHPLWMIAVGAAAGAAGMV